MECPSCPSARLKRVRALGVDLDQCEACDGLWFDEGELTAFRSAKAQSTGQAPPSVQFQSLSEPHASCPQCRASTLFSGLVGTISVLRCTRCRGLFLPKQPIEPEHDPALDAFEHAHDAWYSKGLFRRLVNVLDFDL